MAGRFMYYVLQRSHVRRKMRRSWHESFAVSAPLGQHIGSLPPLVAFECIGVCSYNPVICNCEHFATAATGGECRSLQVQEFVAGCERWLLSWHCDTLLSAPMHSEAPPFIHRRTASREVIVNALMDKADGVVQKGKAELEFATSVVCNRAFPRLLTHDRSLHPKPGQRAEMTQDQNWTFVDEVCQEKTLAASLDPMTTAGRTVRIV
mmetsp:Transcript_44667/g.69902  ORF Transcript_44667/g.69902 Transcript_44667/m.69902 type:complete len:207 (-) Transcript_44667:367-987(-)